MEITSVGKDMKKCESSYAPPRCCRKTGYQFLKMLNTELSYDLVISFTGVHLGRSMGQLNSASTEPSQPMTNRYK